MKGKIHKTHHKGLEMKKIRRICIVSLILICLLVSVFSLNANKQDNHGTNTLSRLNDETANSLESENIYRDKNGYFQFSPPAGWQKEEFLKDPRSKVNFKHPSNGASIAILAREIPRPKTIDALLSSQQRKMTILKQRMNAQIISVGKASIGKIPCVQAIYVLQGVKTTSIVFQHMNISYSIAFGATVKLYDELIGEMERSINTFHPLENVLDLSKVQAQGAQWAKMQGKILLSLGKYDEAIRHYEESAALNPEDWGIFHNLGVLYSKTGKYDLSVARYQKALQLRPDSAITHNNLGAILMKQGKYKAAEAEMRAALRIEIKQDEPEYWFSEVISPSKEELLKKQGKMNELLATYWENLHSDIHTNLGAVLRKQGRIDEAISEYKKALQQCKDDEQKASIYANIGAVYGHQGKYQQSLSYFYQGLKLIREAQSTGIIGEWVEEKKGVEAMLLANIGATYIDLGDTHRALTYLEQSLKIRKEIGAKYDEAMALLNIASIYCDFGDYQQALRYDQQALSLVREIKDKRNEAAFLLSLGRDYKLLHQHQQALQSCQQALDVAKEVGNKTSEAKALYHLGLVHSDIGQYQQALRCQQQALAIAEKINNPQLAWLASCHIGAIFESQGKHDEALELYTRAIDIIETTRKAIKSERYKLGFLENRIFIYDLMIGLLLKKHAQNEEEGHERKAFYYAERRKARAFLDLLAEARVDIREGIAPDLLKKEASIYAKRSDIQSRMQMANITSEERENLRKELEKVREELEFLKQEIMDQNPKYGGIQYSRAVTVEEIQSLLDDGTILLEYYIAENKSALWAITKNEIRFFDLPSKSVLREQVEKYRTSLTMPIWDTTTAEEHQKLGTLLYDELFKLAADAFLVADDFPNYNKVIIVPDDILYYLPFETLIMPKETRREQDGKNLTANHYLIEDYVIRYVQSASVIALIKDQIQDRDTTTKQEELLAFGDAIFESSDKSTTLQVDIRKGFEERGFEFARLVHTNEEVRKIAETLGISLPSKNILLRSDAREKAVKEMDLRKYKRIHFATHSTLSDDIDWLNQPAVVLSLMGNEEGNDGFLQMDEIFNLNMDADMVVLSACNTGLGREVEGEGLIGLTRAFMYAGTPSVVVSLWSVADRSTAKLMGKFYSNLETGMAKSDALRKAKLELMDMKEVDGKLSKKVGIPVTISYSNPYYWSTFVLIGGEAHNNSGNANATQNREAKRKSTVDLGAFIKELMVMKIEGNNSQLAIWCPFEFYVEATLAEGGQTRATVEKDFSYLRPYLTVIVQCGIDQIDGSTLYSSEREVRARAVLKLADGTEIRPLDKVPPMVSIIVAAIKTMLSSEGDPGGANMHVLVFPSKSKQGKPIVDTVKKDELTLVLKANGNFNQTAFAWHTPFDAITNVPPCPMCGESVSAKWSFCPWCGEKLSKE